MPNNIVGNAPNAVVAKSTISFVDAGITSVNTEIIFKVDANLQSYKPGRAINGISGFVANVGYYFVAKQDMDLTAVLVPPISGITQLSTPTSFTATPTSTTQINLAWNAVASATGYVVDRATNSGFTTGVTLGIYNSSGTSYNNTGLTASTTYYYRVRAIAAGYTDSNYATASGTTQTAGGTVENVVWGQLVSATAPGNGDLVPTGTTTPSGGTATKKFGTVNGDYVQMTLPATIADADAAVLSLDDNNDASYVWGSGGINLIAAVYVVSAGLYALTGSSGGSPTNVGTVSAGYIVRLEKSGNDVLVKQSTNGGSSFTTLHTFTGVLTGIANTYIKGVHAAPTTSKILNNVEGLGLLT